MVRGVLILAAVAAVTCQTPAELAGFEVRADRPYQVGELPLRLRVTAVDSQGETVAHFCGTAKVTGIVTRRTGAATLATEWRPLGTTPAFRSGELVIEDARVSAHPISVRVGDVESRVSLDVRRIPGWLSLLAPLVAILIAVLVRRALVALFAGVWVGALIVHEWSPFMALVRVFDRHVVAALVPIDSATGAADTGHAAIILFTIGLGGMVGIIGRSGGTKALVDAITAKATTRRSGMLTAWGSGLVIFFDDYANCMLVGNTVRPFADRVRISREKLAYIVDSTAAPVATVAVVSTWVGYQADLFAKALGIDNGYELFLHLIPYSFYSLFTILFVFLIAVTMRDFGPMRRAELRAVQRGEVLSPEARPLLDRELSRLEAATQHSHWLTAVVPVVSVVAIVAIGLYVSGRASVDDANASLRQIVASADSYAVLIWAAFGGSLVAMVTAVAMRSLPLVAAVDAWVMGGKSMVMAILILVLAWALGDMCKQHLQTGEWLMSMGLPRAQWVPVLTFVVSGAIAFATGSSFSTMAIVIPIVAPLVWAATGDGSGVATEAGWHIRYASLAAVLSGAVFGDHCSPISDTTIMSSMASGADHIDHVRTQAPYAMVCAAIAASTGYIPAGFGVSPWVSLSFGVVACGVVIYFVAKPVDGAPGVDAPVPQPLAPVRARADDTTMRAEAPGLADGVPEPIPSPWDDGE